MQQFIVEGGHSLSGSITPSGNKNEALPALAAVLLTEEPVILRNVPDIADIRSMRALLESVGTQVEALDDHTFQFHTPRVQSTQPSTEISSKIRGSFLLAAPLLARCGQATLSSPGGDKIGLRPVRTHLKAFEDLNVKITRNEHQNYCMQTSELQGADLLLEEASVMGTENILMAAVLAKGTTTIYHAACEPHVQGLCSLLVAMGAKIEGMGTNKLHIEGVSSLHGADYRIQPDHTEVGSFIGLAAVTQSEITICDAGLEYLPGIRRNFERLGVQTLEKGADLLIPKEQSLQMEFLPTQGISKIDDGPWPGFPADLTSIMAVVATQCQGTILIFEKMFESRLFWLDKLISMGAQIILCDPHRAVVSGPSPLMGKQMSSPDIRAGMALLIAALGAKGVSHIQNIQQIDRGYERIDERLQALGAKIERVGLS